MRSPCSSSEIAVGRRLEQDDVVRTLAVPVDLVGQTTAAPGRDLEDGSAGGDDPAGGAVDDRLGPIVRHVRTEDQHQFVAAHAPAGLLPVGNAPLPGPRPLAVAVVAEPKGQPGESSMARTGGADVYPLTTGESRRSLHPSIRSERSRRAGQQHPPRRVRIRRRDGAPDVLSERRLHGHPRHRSGRRRSAARAATTSSSSSTW